MSYRSLTPSEITALQNQGCFSSSWSEISVPDNFSSNHVQSVQFQGKVRIGELGGEVTNSEGATRVSGLFHSKIEECEIGDQTLIDHVHLLRNYQVGDGVFIENVDTIAVNGPTSFGNGFEVEVLNEGGGRELPIFEGLTAQLAYMLVCYRHKSEFVEAMNRMIKDYASDRTSNIGTIGAGTEIINTGSIYDVNIGEHTSIKGTSLLRNGTIASNSYAPACIGEDVIAKNFIVLSGSRVDGGALVDKCFVGQGVEIGKQFSAENSLFFANSEAFHGEAVSLFAGPYTVTHHKSSLLIAGMFSFFNAGSGTNQSNHMYKLGPVHQGIVERGSKTGSFAYMMWPCRVGAYSVVMGKNLANFDTSEFPFSYINVDKEKSILTPGMNLFTVGTRRDSEKWPQRDKRKDPKKADLINFDFLSPYIIQQVISSLSILTDLYEKTSKKQDSVFYKGIRIKRLMLKSTRKYYEMALSIFVGNQLIKRLDRLEKIESLRSLREGLISDKRSSLDKWLDLAGMIAPEWDIHNLMEDVISGSIPDLENVLQRLEKIHSEYDEYSWNWTCRLLSEKYDIELGTIESGQLIEIVSNWKTELLKLDRMILNDAGKEFDPGSKIGFGIDGDQSVVDQDFEAVRGTPEENKFFAGIKKEIEQIEEKAAKLISTITNIPAS